MQASCGATSDSNPGAIDRVIVTMPAQEAGPPGSIARLRNRNRFTTKFCMAGNRKILTELHDQAHL
jgi:hypothetical protein